MEHQDLASGPPRGTPREVFNTFFKLGLTSFGGPIAHLGYFRDELVTRRGWLSDHAYADLVALCQFLPGPASSQVGFALGLMRGGWRGALAAFTAFTSPSALLLFRTRMLRAPDRLEGSTLAGRPVRHRRRGGPRNRVSDQFLSRPSASVAHGDTVTSEWHLPNLQ